MYLTNSGSRDMNRDYLDLQFQDNGRNVRNLADPGILSAEDRKGIDVPFIDFNTILSATENFSLSNKLGQGGFGPVYKVTSLEFSFISKLYSYPVVKLYFSLYVF